MPLIGAEAKPGDWYTIGIGNGRSLTSGLRNRLSGPSLGGQGK